MEATRWIAVALIGVIASLGLTACGGGEQDNTLTSLVSATKFFRFDPDTINVPFDKEAVFTFDNRDTREHNFTTSVFVDRDNLVSVDVAPGENRQIRFRVTERPGPGFLSFYCRFHQGQGMQGKIKLVT
jgi:plastocyanin